LGDQIKKNEVGRACGMYGGQERCTPDIGGEFRRTIDHFENQGVDRGIVLTWTYKKSDGVNIDWIDLTQDRDRRRLL